MLNKVKPEIVDKPTSKGFSKGEGEFRVDSGLRDLWL